MTLIENNKTVLTPEIMITDNNITIESLPNELLVEIFSYLHVKDLSSVSFVCKRWKPCTVPLLEKKRVFLNSCHKILRRDLENLSVLIHGQCSMDTLFVVNDKLYDNRHSYKSESEKKEVTEAIYKTLRRLNDYEEYFSFFYPRMIQEDLPKLIHQKLVDLGNEYFSFIVKKERCSRCGSPNYS